MRGGWVFTEDQNGVAREEEGKPGEFCHGNQEKSVSTVSDATRFQVNEIWKITVKFRDF